MIKCIIGMFDEYFKKIGKSYFVSDRVIFVDFVFVVINEIVFQLFLGYDLFEEFFYYVKWNFVLIDRFFYKKIVVDKVVFGQLLGIVDQKYIDDYIWRNNVNYKQQYFLE